MADVSHPALSPGPGCTLCQQALGSFMALSGACSKLSPLFAKEDLEGVCSICR